MTEAEILTRVRYINYDNDRLTADERLRVWLGLCPALTAYGMPWTRHCDRLLTDAERGRGQIDCTEHEQQIRDDNPQDLINRLTVLGRRTVIGGGFWTGLQRGDDGRWVITTLALVGPRKSAAGNDYRSHAELAGEGRWYEVYPAGAARGRTDEVAGDAQRTATFSRTFARALPTGQWAVITDSYAFADEGDGVQLQNLVRCSIVADLRDRDNTLWVDEHREIVTEDVEADNEGVRVYCNAVNPDLFTWDGREY